MVKLNNSLRLEILDEIKLTSLEKENLDALVKRFITRLRRSAKRLKITCSFFIGGSFGKGTFLKSSSDIDLFIRFNPEYDDSLLSSYLEKILIESKLKYKKQKGSRDYFSLNFTSKGIKIVFELIPTRNITSPSDALNSTDLSIFHVFFLKSKIKENPGLADEIRLAKQFFKAKNLYGAESYINGFSGHSLDILVAYYGSFENLINSIKSWQEEEIIDINNFYSSNSDILENLNNDKKSNLILIDPIIKDRNASRALGNNKYCESILIANKLKSFEKNDFIVNDVNINEILSIAKEYAKNNNFKLLSYKLKFKIKNESEDIVGAKLLKIEKKLKDYFESYDFQLFMNDFHINMKSGVCLMIFLFEKINLPRVKKIIGPKVFMLDAVENFLKNRDYYFIENSRVCIYEPRSIHKLSEISKLNLTDFYKLIGKDISFVTSVRRTLK